MLSSKICARIVVSFVALAAALCFGADGSSLLADSAEKQFRYIHENGQRERPDPKPTDVSEQEINAYLTSGNVQFPAGVESLQLAGLQGAVTAHCRIDFDRVRAGRTNSNPLLSLFSGVHDVVVEAQAAGSNHQGRVHINSASIDGMQVPRFLLQLFVEKYVSPRYPGVGMDSTFALPDKIETATVGQHKLTVVQR